MCDFCLKIFTPCTGHINVDVTLSNGFKKEILDAASSVFQRSSTESSATAGGLAPEKTMDKPLFETPESEVGIAGFHVRLKAMRCHWRLSQIELGELVGISNNAISNAERGQSVCRKRIVRRLANVFKCSANWLMTGQGDPWLKTRK